MCWLPQPLATQASPGVWRRPSAGRKGPLFTVLFICFLLTAALICTQLFMPLGGLPVTEIDNWLVVLLRGTQKTTLHPSPPQIPLQPSATRPKILPFMIQTFGPSSVASLKYQSHNGKDDSKTITHPYLKVDQFLLNISKAALSPIKLTCASSGYGEVLCNLSNSYKVLFVYWVKR